LACAIEQFIAPAQAWAGSAPDLARSGPANGTMIQSVTIWEYHIIALPRFEPPTGSPAGSAAVRTLNEEGARGWEAVEMTAMLDGGIVVLLKRPRSD
jgi:hypothetical protein